jgi:putative SOS response-associated peptidase YedK
MCGRFSLQQEPGDVLGRFEIQGVLFPDLVPRPQIAPGSPVAVITAHGPNRERLLEPMQWGLVPFWARERGSGLINARCETAHEKPSFKNSLKRRRCLIPADGFYEWDKKTKLPTHFRQAGGGLFAFAGLFDEWVCPDGSPLRSFAILTTAPNALVGRVHDRMPVILSGPDAEDAWLDVQNTPPEALIPFFQPFDEARMEADTPRSTTREEPDLFSALV